MGTMVEVADVSKSYRRGDRHIPVLTKISLTVDTGDFVALMGPSGSGKSTLLNLIAGIDRPDAGAIRISGVDISRLDESALAGWRAANIGFVFQFYNLLPVLTAFENVELPLLLTRLTKRERREHIELVLRMVDLEERKDHYPGQLSGGEQQRVAIARAVVTDPALIVADEPTGDLDRNSARGVLALLGRLNRDLGKTIILVTHDHLAAASAHAIMQLDKGELVNEASESI
ncbi:MAG: ABC transporter ATP-binding protein [Chromatiales bacterium]